MIDVTDRHPATRQIVQWFDYGHLNGQPRNVSARCHDLAAELLLMVPDGPELTAGLRKLLEAKDALVRAAVEASAPTCARCGRVVLPGAQLCCGEPA